MIEKLTELKGIGEKRAELLLKLGINSPIDLLYYAPRRYIDFTHIRKIQDVENGESCALCVAVTSPPRYAATTKGLKLIIGAAKDDTGKITLSWFNQPYMINAYKTDDILYIYGRVDVKGSTKRISSPIVYKTNPLLVPVYSLKKGITQKLIRDAVKSALSCCTESIIETLPDYMLEKYKLISLQQALYSLHFPKDIDSLNSAKKRLAFEDMLLFRIAINYMRLKRCKQSGIAFNTDGLFEAYINKLSFTLTDGQINAIIETDMKKPHQMNRLVQGDVGCGKTAVAMYAMFVAYKNNMQSVLLAPTEILANQHYESLCKIMPADKVVLLTGSMSKKAKADAYSKIENGDYSFITGTHALLQSELKFARLGLLICDEQQRFGVEQRTKLQNTKYSPDVLIMSATPIPRTLALVLYGDLDISQISQLPKGRQPIKTRIVPPDKRIDMYKYIAKEANFGKQAYVVCPQIENLDGISQTENVTDLFDELHSLLDAKIGLLHGKMKAADKASAIQKFKNGETNILISTTVIEVGVDIPNAVNMVIESADMFGLSQLHQLRGRIGRGKLSGYCFLVSERGSECERLKALTSTTNGFEISEKDLELRGPGQFLGSEQHGVSELAMLSLACDMDTLNNAKQAADVLITSEYNENTQELINRARRKFANSIDFPAN